MKTNEIYEKFAARTPGMHKIYECIPWRETCFGCRSKEVGGLQIRSYYTEDGYAVGLAQTDSIRTGFPNVTHGGVIATYFDEVLWHQTKRDNFDVDAMTVHSEVDYFAPVPEGAKIKLVALPPVIDGRHYHVSGALLLEDGTIAATGKAHYIWLKTDSEISKDEKVRVLHPSDAELDEIYF